MPIFALPDDEIIFPDPNLASRDGLLAIGGDLSVERLLLAYNHGIFPWFSEGEPIMWWSPNPRFVLFPDKLKISKSMQQVLRSNKFEVTTNQDFENVIRNCQHVKRTGQNSTWITEDIISSYTELHKLGVAHSVEVWENKKLVGGLYGLIMGKCFFGESMFSTVSNASKTGFISFVKQLQAQDFQLIDCQIHSEHLESLGAEMITRKKFLALLNHAKNL
jgi:leucyl/phenylalanyl-tRNA--protein transferase